MNDDLQGLLRKAQAGILTDTEKFNLLAGTISELKTDLRQLTEATGEALGQLVTVVNALHMELHVLTDTEESHEQEKPKRGETFGQYL